MRESADAGAATLVGSGGGIVRDATGTLDCGETCLAPFTYGAVIGRVRLFPVGAHGREQADRFGAVRRA